MKRWLAYIKYILKHKKFVFIECWKAGIPWRGLIHDLSKLGHKEFWPYARFFYAKDGSRITGRTPDIDNAEFSKAWFWHQARNKHHWQYWCQPKDGGTSLKVAEMPEKYRIEMVCDWRAMARAFGNDPKLWYLLNRKKVVLNPVTRSRVEFDLKLIGAEAWANGGCISDEMAETILAEIQKPKS